MIFHLFGELIFQRRFK